MTWLTILSLGKRLVTNKWFWIGILIAIIIYIFLDWRRLQKENRRLSNNYEVVLQDFNKEKTKSGELRVTASELEDIIVQDSILIAHLYDSLDLKAKRIEHLTQLKQEVIIEEVVKWKEKIVYLDGDSIPVKARCFEFKDQPWVSITGCELPDTDTLDIKVEITDNITVVAYKYKDGKWFLSKWLKPWKFETAVENSNPYNKVTIQKNIKVLKR